MTHLQQPGPRALQLLSHPVVAAGIDIGGTKTSAGLVELPSGKLLTKEVVPTQPERGREHLLGIVRDLIRHLHLDAIQQHQNLTAIGIGVCELVSPQGQLMSAHSFDWRDLHLSSELGLPTPVIAEADVRAAALGEARLGAGTGLQHFLYITIGTGISCSLVIHGEPYAGARGATGTFASQSLRDFQLEPGSINASCSLEEWASGPGMVRRYLKSNPRSNITNATELFAEAEAHHPPAVQALQSSATVLGAALGNLINTLDPEALILGGGIGCTKGLFHRQLIEATRRNIWSDAHRDLPILTAQLGTNAGLVGAALRAIL